MDFFVSQENVSIYNWMQRQKQWGRGQDGKALEKCWKHVPQMSFFVQTRRMFAFAFAFALIDQLGCSLEKWARPSYVNSNQQLAAPAKLSQKHNVRKCALNWFCENIKVGQGTPISAAAFSGHNSFEHHLFSQIYVFACPSSSIPTLTIHSFIHSFIHWWFGPFRAIDASGQITSNFLTQASWQVGGYMGSELEVIWDQITSNFLVYNLQLP